MSRRSPPRGAIIALLVLGFFPVRAISPGASLVRTDEMREWLSYIASDELQGRATFSSGLGLAAAYIENHLRAWGVKPGGDAGSYLQTVRVQGVRATSRSSVTVRVGSETRTFRDGEDVTFARNAGSKRSFAVSRVEFVGYGLDVPSIHHFDLRDRDVTGAAVVWLGSNGPRGFDRQTYRSLLTYRNVHVTEDLRATAILGPMAAPRGGDQRGAEPSAQGQASGDRGTGDRPAPDFTTSRRLDLPRAPAVQGNDTFYAFLFSQAPVKYDELKRRVEAQEPLPAFTLSGVTITFNIDADYEIVRTQLTQNVVGIVEGSDPQLKSTYVAFGAHYDHVGYADATRGADGSRPAPPNGRVGAGPADDVIWNGADDDGSGTVGVMSLARAFTQGPRPKRSMIFVWHTGEEIGTYGSLFFADHPPVPIDSIVAQLNIDMIGRNRNDNPNDRNTVYLVGSDRISSELHQISQEANRGLTPPLTLDYEMNDPSDPEQIYYRSDHYSYAAKGIPVIFFTTGLHADYHTSTDEVSKILFDKMTRIVQLVYETGERLGNLDHAPVRDNRGPRAVKGTPW
jgi:hypothetical protein